MALALRPGAVTSLFLRIKHVQQWKYISTPSCNPDLIFTLREIGATGLLFTYNSPCLPLTYKDQKVLLCLSLRKTMLYLTSLVIEKPSYLGWNGESLFFFYVVCRACQNELHEIIWDSNCNQFLTQAQNNMRRISGDSTFRPFIYALQEKGFCFCTWSLKYNLKAKHVFVEASTSVRASVCVRPCVTECTALSTYL